MNTANREIQVNIRKLADILPEKCGNEMNTLLMLLKNCSCGLLEKIA